MARRSANPARRLIDGGGLPFIGSGHSKSRSSPLLSIVLLIVGAILLILYCFSGSGSGHVSDREAISQVEGGGASCTSEVQRVLPILKKAYGESMRKVLHIGPDTCSAVASLWKEEGTEAWGVEPYELDDVDAHCKNLVRKGIVRVADIKYSLPYQAKSFSLVIVSDVTDYLSPKYLNKTLPEFMRLSSEGVVLFSGYPGGRKAKVAELSKFGRPAKFRSASWWIRYFLQSGFLENETAAKKFEQDATKRSYRPACQIFHLKSSD